MISAVNCVWQICSVISAALEAEEACSAARRKEKIEIDTGTDEEYELQIGKKKSGAADYGSAYVRYGNNKCNGG